jgi:hypothetical protein
VNKIQKKIATLNLLAVYSLAIWLFCCHGYDLHSQKQQQGSGTEQYHSASNNFKGEVLQPSTIANASFSNVHASGKNSFNEFSILLKLTDHLASNSIIQYSSPLIKMRILQCKAAIIFPFHNFW